MAQKGAAVAGGSFFEDLNTTQHEYLRLHLAPTVDICFEDSSRGVGSTYSSSEVACASAPIGNGRLTRECL